MLYIVGKLTCSQCYALFDTYRFDLVTVFVIFAIEISDFGATWQKGRRPAREPYLPPCKLSRRSMPPPDQPTFRSASSLKWPYLRTRSSAVARHRTLVHSSVWPTYRVAELFAPPTIAASSSRSPTGPPLATEPFLLLVPWSGTVCHRSHISAITGHLSQASEDSSVHRVIFEHTTIVTD